MKPTDEPNPNEEFSDGAIDSIVDESGGSDGFFSQLRQMTLPEHSWGVIHLMSIGYILLIFPGCYLLFRRRANYKVTYGALLGVVLVSSFGFRAIGRRGYGESTAVNTVAIARPLGDGYYDVTQWSNVFVIDGADYRITHGGIGRLYSTDQEHEQVEGIIDNGVEGAFTVDIPPYSNRSFVHRQKVKGKPVRLVVEEWEADETLNSLKLTAGDSLPEPTGTIYALFKNRLYELSNIKGRLALKSGPRPLTGSLNIDRFDERAYLFYESESRKHVSPAETYARLRDPLIAAGLGVVGRNQLSTFSLPDDRVRIFLYTKAGDAFFAAGDRLGRQSGYVLFCIDVFKPEKP